MHQGETVIVETLLGALFGMTVQRGIAVLGLDQLLGDFV
ncbi:hypothetical protein M2447_001125 [Ereboglobus sp. PH5-10]|nr:hypothetical protein [Ereboglobus sp. PH5-10]